MAGFRFYSIAALSLVSCKTGVQAAASRHLSTSSGSTKKDRVLGYKLGDATTTPEFCRDYCVTKLEDATFFSTQFGFECWCSNALDLDYDRFGESICDMPCIGDETRMCSGFDAFEIYSIESTESLGLYRSRLDESDVQTDDLMTDDYKDIPDSDFSQCRFNTYMCCWTENDGNGMADNTDVCYVVDSMRETTEYLDESEGLVHYRGATWPEDATDAYIEALAGFVKIYDHEGERGYYGNIEGAPTCGCIEDMALVSRADCSTYYFLDGKDGPGPEFTACTNNDLRSDFEEKYPMDELPNLVEDCDNPLEFSMSFGA